MTESIPIIVRPFARQDQSAARQLILKGCGEHWGYIDESLNPDLDDIAASYPHGAFLCAWQGAQLVGTGAYLPESVGTVRIVRMSTERARRRCGVGTKVLAALLDLARSQGYHQAVVETTATWADVVAFYQRRGFTLVGHRDGSAHFTMQLT
jgi:GNAT superfamily N-acetyltransferase